MCVVVSRIDKLSVSQIFKVTFFLCTFIVLLQFCFRLEARELDVSDIETYIWKANPAEYAGEFHFGESENESSLYLVYIDNQWLAQIRSGMWNESGSKWVKSYQNLENVKINSTGSFYSEKYKGKFVKYSTGDGNFNYGLKLVNTWTEGIETEVGQRVSISLPEMFNGSFAEASYRKLSYVDLSRKTKVDLSIAFNEIKARYGYIFPKGSEADTYFNRQEWYQGEHPRVDNFLTWVEIENMKKIKHAIANND